MNFRNIRMVAINKGQDYFVYAIRKGWIFHKYYDLKTHPYNDYWWPKKIRGFFDDCLSEDREKVKSIWLILVGKEDPPWSENVIYRP